MLESDMWLSQCSGANSREVETTGTRTELRTYGCGTKAVNVIRWMLRRRAEQSSGLSADSRRLINDEAANGVSHRLCSRSDGRMRRPSSCTDDHGTKAVEKGVKRMHQRSSRSDGRMRRQSSRTNDCKTKAVRRLRR